MPGRSGASSSRCSAARSLGRLAARAQQGERMRHVGVLMGIAEDDADTKARLIRARRFMSARLVWSS
jgi:hypothetical protein